MSPAPERTQPAQRTRDEAEPLVSVIIPFYNTPAAFLEEAVESVFSQVYGSWELLLVDDGSAGDSTELARDLAAMHEPRVRYLDHPGHDNRGVSASRMLGVSRAAGRYVAFLDSDDVWLPLKLREQVAMMEAHPEVGMSYGSTLYWHSWSGRQEDRTRDHMPRLGIPDGSVIEPPHLFSPFLLEEVAVPCPSSILVRRDVFGITGGFEAAFRTMYEEQVFYSKVYLAVPVLVSHRCWERYRLHDASLCALSDETGRTAAARARFLNWLSAYLVQKGIEDRSILAAVETAQVRHDAAQASGLKWIIGEVQRRSRKWSRRLSNRFRPNRSVFSADQGRRDIVR